MSSARRAVEEIAGHTLVVCALLLSFKIVDVLYDVLWGGQALLLNLLPFKWLIQAADIAIFIAFVYAGVRSMLRAYQGP